MYPLDDAYSRRVIDDMLGFGCDIIGAQGGLFFWLEPNYEFTGGHASNVPANFVTRYHDSIRAFDPLNTPSLTERKARFAMLQGDQTSGSQVWSRYKTCLAQFGIGDELDMLFWSDDRPVAGMAIYRPLKKQAFSKDTQNWAAIQSHLERLLFTHSRLRASRTRNLLSRNYKLLPREIEVIGILSRGASNNDIADEMGISVGTVKTHIVNILDKMGLHSRGAIAACINGLQFC